MPTSQTGTHLVEPARNITSKQPDAATSVAFSSTTHIRRCPETARVSLCPERPILGAINLGGFQTSAGRQSPRPPPPSTSDSEPSTSIQRHIPPLPARDRVTQTGIYGKGKERQEEQGTEKDEEKRAPTAASYARNRTVSTWAITMERLSPWSQQAPRAYIRFVLAFPVPNLLRKRVADHLRCSLTQVAAHHPDFAGDLGLFECANSGAVWLRPGVQDSTINFQTANITKAHRFRNTTFDDLARNGFPPDKYVDKILGIGWDGNVSDECIPAVAVRVFWINGGMLLGIYFHHSFGDGHCINTFLEAFAAATRGDTHERPSQVRLQPPLAAGVGSPIHHNSVCTEDLVKQTPEYSALTSSMGPGQPKVLLGGTPIREIPRHGKAFVFTIEALTRLKNQLSCGPPDSTGGGGPLSINTCLAALTWSHVTAARLATERHPKRDQAVYAVDDPIVVPYEASVDTAKLFIPIDFRSRAPLEMKLDEYFGNAVALGVTVVMNESLCAAAAGDMAALARVASCISGSVAGVDEDFIRERTSMLTKIKDPRHLGLNTDVRIPQDLHFNTWRRLGDQRWNLQEIDLVKATGYQQDLSSWGDDENDNSHSPPPQYPKLHNVVPTAIRRQQDEWSMGNALVLPAKEGDQKADYELLITLPLDAMRVLMSDTKWMEWVDRLI